MSQGKRRTPEQIINCLRDAEVLLSPGLSIPEVCKRLVISPQSYYRWRQQYGGMGTAQLKELKRLQKENSRLRRAVSDLTLDKLILSEAARGNF